MGDLQGAKRGGQSRIVSSVTVFNEILRRKPSVAPVLFEEFYWHYFEPEMAVALFNGPLTPAACVLRHS